MKTVGQRNLKLLGRQAFWSQGPCDLDLWPSELNRDHILTMTNTKIWRLWVNGIRSYWVDKEKPMVSAIVVKAACLLINFCENFKKWWKIFCRVYMHAQSKLFNLSFGSYLTCNLSKKVNISLHLLISKFCHILHYDNRLFKESRGLLIFVKWCFFPIYHSQI
jgi:hypothetical protein